MIMYLRISFSFAQQVRSQNFNLYMTSFDIDSLFTNLPLDETINLCADKLFKRKKKVKGMTKIEFKTLLEFGTTNHFFFLMATFTTRLMESLWVHP